MSEAFTQGSGSLWARRVEDVMGCLPVGVLVASLKSRKMVSF